MFTKLHRWPTRIGYFYIIRTDDGRFHPMYDHQTLGSYLTAQQAAEDLAGGHTLSIPAGVDTAELGIPSEVARWQRVYP